MTQLFTMICNKDSTGDGILPDMVLIPEDCTVTCLMYACNNVDRKVNISLFKAEQLGYGMYDTVYTRTFSAGELQEGIAISPASNSSWAAHEEITFEAKKGNVLRFGVNCDVYGNKLSDFSGYPYGLWIISIGSSYHEYDWKYSLNTIY